MLWWIGPPPLVSYSWSLNAILDTIPSFYRPHVSNPYTPRFHMSIYHTLYIHLTYILLPLFTPQWPSTFSVSYPEVFSNALSWPIGSNLSLFALPTRRSVLASLKSPSAEYWGFLAVMSNTGFVVSPKHIPPHFVWHFLCFTLARTPSIPTYPSRLNSDVAFLVKLFWSSAEGLTLLVVRSCCTAHDSQF